MGFLAKVEGEEVEDKREKLHHNFADSRTTREETRCVGWVVDALDSEVRAV